MTIATSSFDHYLEYPGSSINSLTKAAVSFSEQPNSASKPYEDLYYTKSRIIGCSRKNSLSIPPGNAGIITVKNANADQSYAVANALSRLYLDLYVRKCPTKFIVVPQGAFQSIVNALCQQGYSVVTVEPEKPIPALFMLTIQSDPPGAEEHLVML